MVDRQRKMAELALDAIGEVQIHVDAEGVREEQLADLWNRWECLKPDKPGTMIDKEGKPIEAGWYLDTHTWGGDLDGPLNVFMAGGEYYGHDRHGRVCKMTGEWAEQLVKITSDFGGWTR